MTAHRIATVTALGAALRAGLRRHRSFETRRDLTAVPSDGVAEPDGSSRPVADIEQLLLDALASARSEIERGCAWLDLIANDLEISLGDQPAKGYASHGESWSLALALED